MSDIEQQFAAALAAHGLQPPEIIPDGKLRRFDGPEDRKGKKNAWYVLHADEPAAGAFGCWKSNLSETWCAYAERDLSSAEREARRQHIARAIEQAKAERERAAEDARLKCVELWSKGAPVAADHPYVTRKRIKPAGAKQLRDALLIPLRDETGELRSCSSSSRTAPGASRAAA